MKTRKRKAKTVITDRLSRQIGTVLAVLILCSLALPSAPAQKPDPRKEYALIFGTVWTADNKPAYGVTVKIRRAQDKKTRWELTSDHHGEFAQRVPPGAADYVLWADVKSHKGKPKPETKVHVDNDERVDVSLHLTE